MISLKREALILWTLHEMPLNLAHPIGYSPEVKVIKKNATSAYLMPHLPRVRGQRWAFQHASAISSFSGFWWEK